MIMLRKSGRLGLGRAWTTPLFYPIRDSIFFEASRWVALLLVCFVILGAYMVKYKPISCSFLCCIFVGLPKRIFFVSFA